MYIKVPPDKKVFWFITALQEAMKGKSQAPASAKPVTNLIPYYWSHLS